MKTTDLRIGNFTGLNFSNYNDEEIITVDGFAGIIFRLRK